MPLWRGSGQNALNAKNTASPCMTISDKVPIEQLMVEQVKIVMTVVIFNIERCCMLHFVAKMYTFIVQF